MHIKPFLLNSALCYMLVPFSVITLENNFTFDFVFFFKDEGVESDDLKKDIPLMPPPPDSCSMKLTIKEIWFSFAAPTNVRSPAHIFSRYNFT